MALANDRLNSWLEKFAFATVSIGVTAIAGFQWKLYTEQMTLIETIKNHDDRITRLELETSKIRGEMVSWDTLKRIELYLESMQSKDANRALLNALKAENGARK